MSEDIRVSFPAIQALAADIKQQSQSIQSHLDELASKVSQLIANWDGDAREAYTTAKTQWDSKMEEINTILEELSMKVDEAGMQYQATEAKNAARF